MVLKEANMYMQQDYSANNSNGKSQDSAKVSLRRFFYIPNYTIPCLPEKKVVRNAEAALNYLYFYVHKQKYSFVLST